VLGTKESGSGGAWESKREAKEASMDLLIGKQELLQKHRGAEKTQTEGEDDGQGGVTWQRGR
jgi:hypothetical protein